MCGLSGEITFDGSLADTAAVGRMVDAVAPRGPDGQGAWSAGRVALGHRRLKIIDLSARRRPADGRPALGLTVVFNGCIYNYRELRAELEGDGHRFFSTSDTEVILKALRRSGATRLRRPPARHVRVRGLTSATPAGGARPRPARHQAAVPGRAPRPAALRLHACRRCWPAAGSTPSIDPVALHHYLTLARGRPGAADDPRRRPQAAARRPCGSSSPTARSREHRYWQPRLRARRRTHADWSDARLAGRRRSRRCGPRSRRRMVADVPVGVLLSGGLDSSLIVGLLAEAGQHGLATFSIGFESAGGEEGDEFQYSDVDRRAVRHRPPPHPRSPADELPARSADAIARDERADGQPRRVAFYLLSRGGQRSTSRSCSPGRAPTRSSPATTGTRRWRGVGRERRRAAYASGVLRPRRTPTMAATARSRSTSSRRRPEPEFVARALRARRAPTTAVDAGAAPGHRSCSSTTRSSGWTT